MTLQQLRDLRANGQFHHATYRDFGTVWEGLWIYEKSDLGRGFVPVGCFAKDDPNLRAAEDEIRQSGISVGSFGGG